MRKIVVAWVAALVATFMIVLGTPTGAQAGPGGLVTPSEYVQVQKGWPKADVHYLFDTDGTRMWKDGSNMERKYYATYADTVIFIYYHEGTGGVWRVTDKYWCDNSGCVS